MDRNIITFLINGIHGSDMFDIPGQSPRCIDRYVWIVSVNLHSKSCRSVGNLCANGPKTDHAQLFALDLVACKCFFRFLYGFRNIGIFFILFTPLDTTDHISGCQ